jgi:hypothetical protein
MMKIFIPVIISALFFLNGCGSGSGSGTGKAGSKISFDATSYDFGRIAYGSNGTCAFRFTNTSSTPLVINKVNTSCGCTNPDWPKEPVNKGESGEIRVTYNTEIPGKFQKSITVFSNAENSPVKLLIKGEVEPQVLGTDNTNP